MPNAARASRTIAGLCGLGILLVLGLLSIVIVSKALQVSVTPNPTSQFNGTWKSSDGSMVVNYRPDGTARYRGGGNLVHYFEWETDGPNQLVTLHECSSIKTAWKSHLECWLTGSEGVEQTIEILNQDGNGFTLRNAEGKTSTFVPHVDRELEQSP